MSVIHPTCAPFPGPLSWRHAVAGVHRPIERAVTRIREDNMPLRQAVRPLLLASALLLFAASCESTSCPARDAVGGDGAALFVVPDGYQGPDSLAGHDTSASPCLTVCPRAAAADCATNRCEEDCQQLVDLAATGLCAAEVEAWLTCAAQATFACDEYDTATTTACPDEDAALAVCLGGEAPVDGSGPKDDEDE